MGAQATPTSDELPASLHSAAFVAGQCPCEVSFSAGERIGKRLGILRSLGDAGADVRPSNEGRVTHERNTTKGHARRFEIENSREDWLASAGDELRELRRQECTSGQLEFGDSAPSGSEAVVSSRRGNVPSRRCTTAARWNHTRPGGTTRTCSGGCDPRRRWPPSGWRTPARRRAGRTPCHGASGAASGAGYGFPQPRRATPHSRHSAARPPA